MVLSSATLITEGVKCLLKIFGIIIGLLSFQTDTKLFVVPKSIPIVVIVI